MDAQEQTATTETVSNSDAQSDEQPSALDFNNAIRGQEAACLLITDTSQAQPIETLYVTINRNYFRIQQFGSQSTRIASIERHTMSAAVEAAQNSTSKAAQIAAYSQTALGTDWHEDNHTDDNYNCQLRDDLDYIRSTFETDGTDPSAGYGLSREELDEASDEHLAHASSPTDDRAGGY